MRHACAHKVVWQTGARQGHYRTDTWKGILGYPTWLPGIRWVVVAEVSTVKSNHGHCINLFNFLLTFLKYSNVTEAWLQTANTFVARYRTPYSVDVSLRFVHKNLINEFNIVLARTQGSKITIVSILPITVLQLIKKIKQGFEMGSHHKDEN